MRGAIGLGFLFLTSLHLYSNSLTNIRQGGFGKFFKSGENLLKQDEYRYG
jgi:hypothetical protein